MSEGWSQANHGRKKWGDDSWAAYRSRGDKGGDEWLAADSSRDDSWQHTAAYSSRDEKGGDDSWAAYRSCGDKGGDDWWAADHSRSWHQSSDCGGARKGDEERESFICVGSGPQPTLYIAGNSGAAASGDNSGDNSGAAVADNSGAALAAVAPSTLATSQIFDLGYFINYGIVGHWKQHNAALKYFRMICERDGDDFFWFSNDGADAVGTILHDDVGTEYTFDETKMIPWKWQEMIAQMDRTSMLNVVGGPEGRSRGLVGLSFSKRPNSYDHKRAHAAVNNARTPQRQHIWDFIAHRADGSGIRLHQNWSSTKIETYSVDGHDTAVAEPARGPGAYGPAGTFRHYVALGDKHTLRFNGQVRLGPNAVFPAPKPKAKSRPQ